MEGLDVLTLSRIQFAANISFHILFPTITIALGWVLVYFKIRYHLSREQLWMDAYLFWIKVFALSFALGVVSGVTMSFQFGTNWPGFMNTVGNIAGPLLGYEVLTAFFLEATFLGVMLFGRSRVPERVHTLATILVAVGTSLSAFWILALNSWMHTPQGFEMREGVAYATNWFEIIFNPSFPYRLTHVLLASGLTSAFLVAGLSAYRYKLGDRSRANDCALRVGVQLAALLIPLQIVVGDFHGLNTFEHQPAKIAAIEGVWETEECAPLLLFAIPDDKQRKNLYPIGIPCGASLILTHELNGKIRGLNEFQGAHPPSLPLFWAFRTMVGVGMLMLLVSWWGSWTLRKARQPNRYLIIILIAATFSGWVATIAGWYVTEIGRQPFLVSGVLKTADAVAQVPSTSIGLSLGLYLSIYVMLLLAYVSTLFFLARKAKADVVSDNQTSRLEVHAI
ncbi:MAG: cytochrome ubiquinol oxidase subunit I [Pseudomonadota bacterium]